jgi:hypothetical protein
VLRSRKDNTVSIGIVRDKKEQTITLTLPERKQSEQLEESFKMPEISKDIQIDLSGMKTELAKVQPRIEFALQQAQRVTDEAKNQLCQQQKTLKKQKFQLDTQKQKVRKQLLDEKHKLQMELHFRSADI